MELQAGQRTTVIVPVGQSLNIAANAGASGSIVRFSSGSEPYSPVVYSGAALQFGPSDVLAQYALECYVGSMPYEINPAIGPEEFGDAAAQDLLRQYAKSPFEAIVFTAQVANQVIGDLNKIKCGTTGATDATYNLLSALTAGEGAVQQVMKDDEAGIGRLIIKAAGVALGLCAVAGEVLTFTVRNGAWMLVHNGGPMLLRRSNVGIANVAASTAENVLVTIPIPAGLLGLNRSLLIDVNFGQITNNANVKTYRARLGGTGIDGTTLATAPMTSFASFRHVSLISNRNVGNSQVSNSGGSGIGGTTIGIGSGAVDTTVDQNLYITVQHATGSDASTLERHRVDLLH